jgi:hypothetical protein
MADESAVLMVVLMAYEWVVLLVRFLYLFLCSRAIQSSPLRPFEIPSIVHSPNKEGGGPGRGKRGEAERGVGETHFRVWGIRMTPAADAAARAPVRERRGGGEQIQGGGGKHGEGQGDKERALDGVHGRGGTLSTLFPGYWARDAQ